MNIAISARTLSASLIGAIYGWATLNIWGYYAANSPLNDWFMDIFARHGQEIPYLVSIYAHDVVVNVLLAVPAAAVFIVFRNSDNWASLMTAVASASVVSYWDTNWSSLSIMLDSPGFWAGLGMSLLSLPIAFVGIRALRQR